MELSDLQMSLASFLSPQTQMGVTWPWPWESGIGQSLPRPAGSSFMRQGLGLVCFMVELNARYFLTALVAFDDDVTLEVVAGSGVGGRMAGGMEQEPCVTRSWCGC